MQRHAVRGRGRRSDLLGAVFARVGVLLPSHEGLMDLEDAVGGDVVGEVDGALHGVNVGCDERGVGSVLSQPDLGDGQGAGSGGDVLDPRGRRRRRRRVRPRREPSGAPRSHLHRFAKDTITHPALEAVRSDHVDLDSERVGKSESEVDLVEQRGLVREVDEEIDVRPAFVVPSADGTEDPGRDSVVLGHQRPDRISVLFHPRGRSHRERTLDPLEHLRRGHPAVVLVRRQIRLGNAGRPCQL